jgi:hypothetical protein
MSKSCNENNDGCGCLILIFIFLLFLGMCGNNKSKIYRDDRGNKVSTENIEYIINKYYKGDSCKCNHF